MCLVQLWCCAFKVSVVNVGSCGLLALVAKCISVSMQSCMFCPSSYTHTGLLIAYCSDEGHLSSILPACKGYFVCSASSGSYGTGTIVAQLPFLGMTCLIAGCMHTNC